MIDAIGFFHLATGHDAPIESLKTELRRCGNPRNTLLVLPEAFNNGKLYHQKPFMAPNIPAAVMLRELADLAVQSGITFVGGMLAPPFNSAFLVEQGGWRLLSHKKSYDGTRNYLPWTGQDTANPFLIDAVSVAVLLCNEVENAEPTVQALNATGSERKVICVAACMTESYFTDEALGCLYWSGIHVILANSRPDGCGSFITDIHRRKRANYGRLDRPTEQNNQIQIRTWAHLNGT